MAETAAAANITGNIVRRPRHSQTGERTGMGRDGGDGNCGGGGDVRAGDDPMASRANAMAAGTGDEARSVGGRQG